MKFDRLPEMLTLVAPDNEVGLSSPDGVFALNVELPEVQKLLRLR